MVSRVFHDVWQICKYVVASIGVPELSALEESAAAGQMAWCLLNHSWGCCQWFFVAVDRNIQQQDYRDLLCILLSENESEIQYTGIVSSLHLRILSHWFLPQPDIFLSCPPGLTDTKSVFPWFLLVFRQQLPESLVQLNSSSSSETWGFRKGQWSTARECHWEFLPRPRWKNLAEREDQSMQKPIFFTENTHVCYTKLTEVATDELLLAV